MFGYHHEGFEDVINCEIVIEEWQIDTRKARSGNQKKREDVKYEKRGATNRQIDQNKSMEIHFISFKKDSNTNMEG